MKLFTILPAFLLAVATAHAVDYATLNYPDAAGGSTYLTGIRGEVDPSVVVMTGVYTPTGNNGTQGLLYEGGLNGVGTWTAVTATVGGTTATSTALYGPNTVSPGNIRAVGSYKVSGTAPNVDHGLLYVGTAQGVGTYQNFDAPFAGTINTIAHSTHGQLAVGNYDTTLASGKAFIYNFNGSDTVNSANFMDLSKPGAISITAYGVWNNGGTSYTIAGGFSNVNSSGIDEGYLVDYDSATNTFTHWTEVNYNNASTSDLISHFDGITSDGAGGYNLTGDEISTATGSDGLGFFAHVGRNPDGTFTSADWTGIEYPGSVVTSGNSVYENSVIGIYTVSGTDVTYGYVAAVPEPSVKALAAAGVLGLGLVVAARISRRKAGQVQA